MATSPYNLQNFIQLLEDWGLSDVLLPFLLIFTVMFAILTKSRVLGESKKNLNLIIALVIALLVVVPHVTNTYPPNYDPVDAMNQAIPNFTVFIVAFFAVLLLIGMVGGSIKTHDLSFFIAGWVLTLAAIIFVNSVYPNVSIWVPVISLMVIIYAIIKQKKPGEPGGGIAKAITVVGFSLVLLIFGNAVGWFKELPWWLQDPKAQSILFTVVIISAIVGLVARDDKKG